MATRLESSVGFGYKRRQPRAAYLAPVMVRRVGARTTEELTSVRVLGLGGCMFVSSGALGRGSLVALLLTVKGRVVRAKARVAYEVRNRGGELEVGVEFLHLDPIDQSIIQGAMPPGAAAD